MRRQAPWWLALLAVCTGASTGALRQDRPPVRPNLLLVTLDTVRADRLGAYGDAQAHTPTLDALAASGVRFADATAQAALTYPAHVALMTGRYPGRFGVHLNGMNPLPDQADTLAERLHAAGYRTGAIVASVIVDQASGLSQGFDTYDDDMPPVLESSVALSELQRTADEVAARAVAWLDARPAAPWFLWVHFYDAHLPYSPPSRFDKVAPGRPYDGEIAFVDEQLARILGRLDRPSTVILIVGDHGESLGDHGEADHGYYIYDSTLHVPFIVAGPGIAPRVVTEQVRGVDVAPTLDTLAGVSPSSDLDGESLVPLLQGGTRRAPPLSFAESWYPRLHFGWSELRSLRVGELKYIAAPKPELYDLRADPGETRNLAIDRASVAGRMAADLERIAKAVDQEVLPSANPLPDSAAMARLRALGYVGAFAPTATVPSAEDPKDHLREYQRYRVRLNRALGALDRGELADATTRLKEMLAENVRAFEVHLYLGTAYAAQQEPKAALGEYDAAAQLNPAWAMPHFEAAKVLLATGDVAAAIARCRQGLQLEPRSSYGLYTLGVVYQRAGLVGDAADTFRRAIAANDRDPRAHANLADALLKLGDLDGAVVEFERMVALGFRAAPAQYNLGLIALKRGDRTEAARRFRLALDADPAFKPARDALARLR